MIIIYLTITQSYYDYTDESVARHVCFFIDLKAVSEVQKIKNNLLYARKKERRKL